MKYKTIDLTDINTQYKLKTVFYVTLMFGTQFITFDALSIPLKSSGYEI